MSCGVCEKCIAEDYGTNNNPRIAFHCDAEGEHKGWVVGFNYTPNVERPAWCPKNKKNEENGNGTDMH